MGLEFEDRSNKPPTQEEFDEAIEAIHKAMVRHITSIPPELAVSLGVVSRCLKFGKAIFAAMEKQEK